MLDSLPAKALLTGDAGFVGYDFLKTVLDSGRQILVRVGSNVTLLKQLGYVRESHNTVYAWPDKAAAKNSEPLVFRLITVQAPKSVLYLIVSVRDEKQLSNRQVAEIYHARWGVEVYYRHFKQTFGRRKLRSHSADNARIECDWSLLGLWAIGLYAMAELSAHNIPPSRLSIARALRAFRRTARDYLHPADPRHTLRIQLRAALIDEYKRTNKKSRDYPRKKAELPPGPPRILNATKSQIRAAKKLKASKKG